jgi:hypothetical protein
VNFEVDIGFAPQRPLQLENRAGVNAGHLPAEAGCGNHKMDLISHQQLRGGISPPAVLTKQ